MRWLRPRAAGHGAAPPGNYRFATQPVQPLDLASCTEPSIAAFRQLQVIGLMPGAVVVRRAARVQLFASELTDQLKHPEPRLGRLARSLHQALVHQFGDQFQNVEAAFGVGHLLDRLEVGAAGEDRQPGEEHLALGRQQRMAPGDGVAKRPLPGREIHRPFPQELQRLLSYLLQQGLRRQHPQPCRSQLNRQRQAVQTSGELSECGKVLSARLVTGTDAPSAIQEQPHRRRDCRVGRNGQRLEAVNALGPDAEDAAASHKHLYRLCRAQQVG